MTLIGFNAPPTNSRARRGEGDKTRNSILTATAALLEELRSEQAVSIRAVSERAGVTAPTIYRYFGDKDHLIFEVCSMHFDQFEDDVIAPALAAHDDPLDALAAIARAYVRFGVEQPEHYRVMFMGHTDHTPEEWADTQMFANGGFATIVNLVQRCVDEGDLRDDLAGEPQSAALNIAFALWAGVHGLVALVVSKPRMPGPELETRIDSLTDVLLRGALAADSPRRAAPAR